MQLLNILGLMKASYQWERRTQFLGTCQVWKAVSRVLAAFLLLPGSLYMTK